MKRILKSLFQKFSKNETFDDQKKANSKNILSIKMPKMAWLGNDHLQKVSLQISGLMVLVLSLFILIISIRGISGNPRAEQLLNPIWKGGGPFELSPESGRFALTYSIVETGSVFFPVEIARFTTPDVGYSNGRYVSLFAPALSFIVIPGYLLGKMIGYSQVGTFAMVSLFAFLNVLMIRLIAIRLGASKIPALIGGLIFLFATPAYTYGVNLYQHHVTTFILLVSVYLLISFRNFWSTLLILFLFGVGVTLDYPNFFILGPILFMIVGRVLMVEVGQRMRVKVNIFHLLAGIGVILPMLFFFWFNNVSYGGPLRMLGGPTVITVTEIDTQGKPIIAPSSKDKFATQSGTVKEEKISGLLFFKTRNLLNGFYIHFISPDRGILYYTPVMFFGFVGLILAVRKKVDHLSFLVSSLGVNILLYSMWGDPWGGWAFGSRYLIPTYAILSLFVALMLTYWRKKWWVLTLFAVVTFYSIAVNALGAITTSSLPPQVQVLELEQLSGTVQRYTYQRNWEMLLGGHSKSFVYQTFLQDSLSPLQFYQMITVFLCLLIGLPLLFFVLTSFKKGSNNV